MLFRFDSNTTTSPHNDKSVHDVSPNNEPKDQYNTIINIPVLLPFHTEAFTMSQLYRLLLLRCTVVVLIQRS
jgi:hypothetical protein